MEILGDLKKEAQEGKAPPEDRVKDFANKLFPMETVVNLHYKVLLRGDLLGNPISFDGRPHVGIKKAVASESGMRGYLIEETEEEKSIYKWKDGNFTEADHELSALWRMSTTQEDLLERLKKSLSSDATIKFADFQELNKFVTEIITSPATQEFLLISLFQNYDIDAMTSVQIFGRWNQEGKPLIKDFAPFAFHCLKVDTLFLYGLTSGLIGTRPTNRVDLEYLYYLPFGNIFTSNDKVHKNLVPLLLQDYQRFIVGPALKEDLKNIVAFLNTLEIEERRKFKNVPPIIDSSITFQLWKEFFNYPERSNWNRDISDKEKEMMKQKMKEFERALDGESINLESGEDAEFVIKKSLLSKTDPCFCGSGKKVIDCCIPEEKFNSLALRRHIKNEIKASYAKADHVRFSFPVDKELPAIVFAYNMGNIDSKGHIGLIQNFKNEELKLIGTLEENMLTLSFVEIETGEIIKLEPLPCNPRQMEVFLKNKYNRISILWGLVNPENRKDLIIPIPDDGSPPSQIIIKGFELT
ncbi:MAG TPA: SEC-C domain-containing protein [Sphingobacteriaceae bacterium]